MVKFPFQSNFPPCLSKKGLYLPKCTIRTIKTFSQDKFSKNESETDHQKPKIQ